MKKKTIKVIVMSGYGLNCEEETKYAFEWAGKLEKKNVQADIVHINDLIKNPKILALYDVLAFPGGFSYGDDTGSGKAYANKFKNHLSKELAEFMARDTLTIGICNGFQIITNLGLVGGALTHNSGGRYLDRWVDLKVVGKSPWLSGIKKLSVPIAHGEGRYIIDTKGYSELKKKKAIAFTYEKGEICKFQNMPANPNGAMHDIAGVLGYNGRVLGLMPHPERAMFAHQSPLWQLKKEGAKRKKLAKVLPLEIGQGIVIFRNGVKYFNKRELKKK